MGQKDTINSAKAVTNNNQSSPGLIMHGILLIIIINLGFNIFTYIQNNQTKDPPTIFRGTNGGNEQSHVQQLIYDDTQLKNLINSGLKTTNDDIINSIKQQLKKFYALMNTQTKNNMKKALQQYYTLKNKKPTKTGTDFQKSAIALLQQVNEQIKNTKNNITQLIKHQSNRIIKKNQNSINHNIKIMGKYFQKQKREDYYRFQSMMKEIQLLYQDIEQIKEIQQKYGGSGSIAEIEENLQNNIKQSSESDKFKNPTQDQSKKASDWSKYQFDQIDLSSYIIQRASDPYQLTFDLSELFFKSNSNRYIISPGKFAKLVEAQKQSQETLKFDGNEFQLETLDLSHNYLSQQDLNKVISSLLENYNSIFQNITRLYLSTYNNKIKSLQKILGQKQNPFLYLEHLNLQQNQHLNLKQIVELSQKPLKFLKTLAISESSLLPVFLPQNQKKKNENIEAMFSNVQKLIINIKEKWPLFELLIIYSDSNNRFRSPQFYKTKDELVNKFLLKGWFGQPINLKNQHKQSQKVQSQTLSNNFLVIWQ